MLHTVSFVCLGCEIPQIAKISVKGHPDILQNCTIPYSDPVEVSIPTAKEKVHRAGILPDITLCQPIVD